MEIKKYEFKQFGDDRGTLVAIEEKKDIPFEIKRVYYMYDTGKGIRRGYHAHKSLEQILICISGSCKVLLDNGKEKEIVQLNKRYEGLYIKSNIWREMFDFSQDAVLMVLASEYYNEDDYIRDYEKFLDYISYVQQNTNIFIHSNAIVDTNMIGNNTKIWGFTHVLSGAKIGCNCNLNEHVFVEDDVIIGNNVTVKCGVYIWNGLRIKDDVFIGPSVTFTNDKTPRSKQYPLKFSTTVLNKGCSIGANATILCDVTIGEYATVGAGAVVTKDVKPYEVVVGNPAVFKNYNCICGKTLTKKESNFRCECGKTYKHDAKQNILFIA